MDEVGEGLDEVVNVDVCKGVVVSGLEVRVVAVSGSEEAPDSVALAETGSAVLAAGGSVALAVAVSEVPAAVAGSAGWATGWAAAVKAGSEAWARSMRILLPCS